MHLVLSDDLRPFALLLNRDQSGQRLRGDDDRGGVNGVLATQTLEAFRRVDDLPDLCFGVVRLTQTGSI